MSKNVILVVEIHMTIGLGTHPYNKAPSLPLVRTNNSWAFNNVDNVVVCVSRCSLTPVAMFSAPEGVNRTLPIKHKNVHAVSNCMQINVSLG
jgi:hypothetical protein